MPSMIRCLFCRNPTKTEQRNLSGEGHGIYKDLISRKGNAFLHSSRFSDALKSVAPHIATVFNVTSDEAVEEFRRFLALKASTADHNATKISPTPLMDHLWHSSILDTQFYNELQAALGCFLHHRPEGASSEEGVLREARLKAMVALYTTYFGGQPLGMKPETSALSDSRPITLRGETVLNTERKRSIVIGRSSVTNRSKQTEYTENSLNPKINLFVKDLTGATKNYFLSIDDSINIVKHHIQNQTGIPPCHQRLIYQGRQLEDYTLRDSNVCDGSTFHLVLRLAGC